MNGHEELVERLAIKRRHKIGELSSEGFNELQLAVKQNPESFIDDDEERAFSAVVGALDTYGESLEDDDLRDDIAYEAERGKRYGRMRNACKKALELDPQCLDARLLSILASNNTCERLFSDLQCLHDDVNSQQGKLTPAATGDAWTNVFDRPRLRIEAALARACVDTARFSLAKKYCVELLTLSPLDWLGARNTCALVLARLEDEDGFNWLDARFSHHGNAWFHLSRVILQYKLGRMGAARRALRGYDNLCLGGAYTLMQPFYVERYLPDRPPLEPGSFDESVYAVFEADPIIADMPEFIRWAGSQTDFMASARSFASNNGFDWHDYND